jgi:hypothetical protein
MARAVLTKAGQKPTTSVSPEDHAMTGSPAQRIIHDGPEPTQLHDERPDIRLQRHPSRQKESTPLLSRGEESIQDCWARRLSGWLHQRGELGQDFSYDFFGRLPSKLCLSSSPVQALDLIGEHHSADLALLG